MVYAVRCGGMLDRFALERDCFGRRLNCWRLRRVLSGVSEKGRRVTTSNATPPGRFEAQDAFRDAYPGGVRGRLGWPRRRDFKCSAESSPKNLSLVPFV
jgi:hypothetical protein